MGTEKPDQPPKGKKDKMAEHSCSLSLSMSDALDCRTRRTKKQRSMRTALLLRRTISDGASQLRKGSALSALNSCVHREQIRFARLQSPCGMEWFSPSLTHSPSLVQLQRRRRSRWLHSRQSRYASTTDTRARKQRKKKNALDLDADCILAHAATRICCVPHGVSCAATDSSSLNSHASIACPHGLSTRVRGLTLVLQTQLEGEAQREGVFSRVCVGKMEKGGASERGGAEWSGGGWAGGMRRTQLG